MGLISGLCEPAHHELADVTCTPTSREPANGIFRVHRQKTVSCHQRQVVDLVRSVQQRDEKLRRGRLKGRGSIGASSSATKGRNARPRRFGPTSAAALRTSASSSLNDWTSAEVASSAFEVRVIRAARDRAAPRLGSGGTRTDQAFSRGL